MTPLLYIKLLRDLRTIWSRMALMVLAMSVTLVVFSGVLYTWGITGREMARAYQQTQPASATMLLERRLEADRMAAIVAAARRQPEIIEAAARTQCTLQIQQEGGEWSPNPLQIFVAAPDDPMRIETFKVAQGRWPPAAGEILLDHSSFDLLGLEVGDAIVVQAPDGKPVSLRVSGAVYYPALAPSFQERKGHGFLSSASLPIVGEPAMLDALKIQVADRPGLITPSHDRDVIVVTARELATWLEETYGVAVREIQVPTPFAHPHQGQADALLLGLLAFGVAGLVLSAILVATLLHGLFTQHIPQIGIMKATGARSSQMLQVYLLMTLVIAVTATALAIGPGILIGRSFAPAILTLLGVEAERLTAPWWMYGVVVASGLGVPLLFSLVSLLKTSRTTVREALDDRGVARHGDIAIRFDAELGRLCGLDRTVLLAFRNLFRRRARLLLSVGLLTSAGAVFVGGMSTMAGFQASLDQARALRRWDVEVHLTEADSVSATALTNLVAGIPDVTHVEAWRTEQTSILPPGQQLSITRTYPDQGHGSIAVTVNPPRSPLMIPPPLLEGRWLRPRETGAVVISQAVLTEDFSSLQSGDTIQLSLGGRPTSWQVVGVAESAGHGRGLFVTEAGFRAATGVNRPNLLRLVTDTHDEATRTAVAQAAERVLTEAGLVVRSAVSVSRVDAAGAGHMLPLILVFLGLAVAMGVVGFAGLASTMSTSVLERIREFGVMCALGAPAATVRRLVVLEGIFIAVVSCVVAAPPTVLLTAVMIGYLPLPVSVPFQISVSGVVMWVIMVVLGAVLATLVPAFRASRRTVREALAYL